MVFLGIVGLILFYLVLVVSLALIPLGLPGNWFMLAAAALFALLGDLNLKGSDWVPLLVVTGLAGLGELIELGIRIVGSKLADVPTGAIVAAIVGGLVGALIGVPIFLVGSLLGLLLGIFVGALLYGLLTVKDLKRSVAMALTTTFSQIVALFAKTAIGLSIIIYLTTAIF